MKIRPLTFLLPLSAMAAGAALAFYGLNGARVWLAGGSCLAAGGLSVGVVTLAWTRPNLFGGALRAAWVSTLLALLLLGLAGWTLMALFTG